MQFENLKPQVTSIVTSDVTRDEKLIEFAKKYLSIITR